MWIDKSRETDFLPVIIFLVKKNYRSNLDNFPLFSWLLEKQNNQNALFS